VRKDGSRFWANSVLSAIHDRDQLIGFAKVVRDVTERRQAQNELAARAQQQAAAAELGLHALQSRDLHAVMDRAVAVARATLEVDMVSLFELAADRRTLSMRAGVGWRENLPGDRPPAVTVSAAGNTDIGYTLQSPWPVVVEDQSSERRFGATPFLREHGVVGGLSVVVRGAGSDGHPYGVLGAHVCQGRQFRSDEVHFLQAVANVVAGAIARAHAEEQLLRAQREADQERDRKQRAEAALEERDEFISVAAHELRTPLTALQLKLQSVAHALRREMVSHPEADRWTQRVDGAVRQADRLGELVERLLDVSRLVGGRLDLDLGEVDLAEVVTEVVQELADQAAQAMGSPIDLAAEPVTGRWDRSRLQQVVINLLSNALKYGTGKPISVKVERRGAMARLTVTDHGIGIAAQDQMRLFGRFERAASVRNYGGMGLGLYICRHIVEAHGGSIDVRSEPGRGSTFCVELPTSDAR
jgi:signal transduction histidine kinase